MKGRRPIMTETREMQQLTHAALDVIAPWDRFQYLRGYIAGYKQRDAEAQQFQIARDDSQGGDRNAAQTK